MARGRMINTTIATDKRLNDLSIDAELVYLMAIPQLDRDGLIHAEPLLLWAKVCPRRPELMSKMADILREWIAQELVSIYQDNGDAIAHFCGFQKNQAMTHYDREAPSTFSVPPGYLRTDKGLVPDPLQPTQKVPLDELRTNSGLAPDEVPPKLIEVKVKDKLMEGKVITPDGVPSTPTKHSVSVQQDMFGAVADTCELDMKLKASTIGKTAKQLLDAGYTPEQVRGFKEWWQADQWRMDHTPVPSIHKLMEILPQFKNGRPATAPVYANGNGKSKVEQSIDAVHSYFAMKEGTSQP